MPITRSFGKPVASLATQHITSSGFDTTMTIAFGEVFLICSLTDFTMPAFVLSRSSRLMPGLRAMPAVMTTMSELAVSS